MKNGVLPGYVVQVECAGKVDPDLMAILIRPETSSYLLRDNPQQRNRVLPSSQ